MVTRRRASSHRAAICGHAPSIDGRGRYGRGPGAAIRTFVAAVSGRDSWTASAVGTAMTTPTCNTT